MSNAWFGIESQLMFLCDYAKRRYSKDERKPLSGEERAGCAGFLLNAGILSVLAVPSVAVAGLNLEPFNYCLNSF